MTRSRLYTVRKRMSMLFQSGALFTDLNVFDNVAYPLREHTHLPPALLHTTVMMKLEAVGLRGAAKLMPSELSGGMARRAALARAIALEPDLIMFDEPFVGQDPITMGVLVKLISNSTARWVSLASWFRTMCPRCLASRTTRISWRIKRLSPTVAPSRYGRIPILGFVSSLMVLPTVRCRSVILLATITMIY